MRPWKGLARDPGFDGGAETYLIFRPQCLASSEILPIFRSTANVVRMAFNAARIGLSRRLVFGRRALRMMRLVGGGIEGALHDRLS
jgi:hypothetical protein